MKYGIIWYVGEGEHDYKEVSRSEYATMRELLKGLLDGAERSMDEDYLFDALDNGPQDVIYWMTDDFGFAFYRPGSG